MGILSTTTKRGNIFLTLHYLSRFAISVNMHCKDMKRKKFKPSLKFNNYFKTYHSLEVKNFFLYPQISEVTLNK